MKTGHRRKESGITHAFLKRNISQGKQVAKEVNFLFF